MFYLILIFIFPSLAHADWFQTPDQQAFQAFQQQRFEDAAQLFNDPYQQGVSWYRAGKYSEAERAFSQVTRPEKQADAQYNLGNTFYQQKQYDKAVSAYQSAQRLGKNDADVMHNLQLAKKQVQKQQQAQQNQTNNKQPENNQKDNTSKDSQNSNQSSQQSNNSQQNQKDNNSQNSNSDKSEQSSDKSQQNSAKNSQAQEHSDTERNSPPQPNTAQNSPEPSESSSSTNKAQENQVDDKQAVKNSSASKDNAASPQKQSKQAIAGNSTEPSQNQQDMLANAWLDQVAEDSQQLLRNQFKIDQYLVEQQRMTPPKQDW